MSRKVHFFSEDTDFSPAQKTLLKQWVADTVRSHGRQLRGLNFVFCSDEYLYQMNVAHLNHHTYTDIITFDNAEGEGEVEGDIFISVDRVRDNAAQLGHDFALELHRVIIHGVLHLLGHQDKKPDQKAAMRAAEDQCLADLARRKGV
ncbi:MAG: rRNA maturation RNase YbeY [Bernardetiaceae bacterium]|jgi:rRNA maturation RNase YbeY|nr:rRNA maturation RNase YbeY [Bernardetiaceae bacterium]